MSKIEQIKEKERGDWGKKRQKKALQEPKKYS